MLARSVRWIVPFLFLTAGAGAGVWVWAIARHVTALEQQARQTIERIDRVGETLDVLSDLELRYASSGYADSASLHAASNHLSLLISRNASALGDSLAARSGAAASVAEISATLGGALRGAQDNLDAGLDLMAADLLFTETSAARRDLRARVRALRALELNALTTARDADLTQAWAVLATLTLLAAWALIRWSRTTRPAPRESPASTDTATPPVAVPPDAPASTDPDLVAAAELCTDIARLESGGDVQSLLARIARLMRAHGVVLWMAAGDELFPVAAHGYELSQLNQLGPLGRSTPNATATAWCSGRLQQVPASDDSRAALVVPLLGPDRCIGVLAAEIDPTFEANPSVQAVAMLLAAQLAAALGAWPAASSEASSAEVVPFSRAAASLSS